MAIGESISAWRLLGLGDRVSDAGCGLRIGRAEMLERVAFFRGAHRFLPTLLRLQGAEVLEVPVNHRPRPRGQSRYGNGLGRTFVALRDAFGVRWLEDRKIRGDAREI